jgi:hypothetical protein
MWLTGRITDRLGPVNQSEEYSMLAGRTVATGGIQMRVYVSRLPVYSVFQGAVGSPVNGYIQEGDVTTTGSLHGETYGCLDAAKM